MYQISKQEKGITLMPQTVRRISIKGEHRQLFWETVSALGQHERVKRGDANPFLAIHVSDIIIDTAIAMAAAVENNDQECIARLQARAKGAPTSFSPPSDREHIRLSINTAKKAAFWSALTVLAQRVLQRRGGRNPFEAVNVSALITGVFFELGGYPLSPDEQVTSPLAMQRLLTITIPQQLRSVFWGTLLKLANSKSALESHNPFKGIDRSQLVIDLVIALADIQQTGDTKPLFALTGTPPQEQPDLAGAQQILDSPTLVLYINEKNRAPFWDALTTLGTHALSKQGADPFRGVSASALIIDTVLALGDALLKNDWKRLSDLIDREEPVPVPS